MLRLVRFCVSDRPCIALCVALILSLSIAHLADSSVATAVPEHQLGRIRGTNQAWSEVGAGSCTTVNVTTANNTNPPPPPGTVYVSALGCNALNAGFPCLFCGNGAGFVTYESVDQPGDHPINLKPIGLVACMTGAGGGGLQGNCVGNLCANQNPYDCTTTGAKWTYQGGGGPP